jgi:hypothetical protein
MMCESNKDDEYKCRQSRHANAKRMQPYKRETSELSAQIQDAMRGKRLDTHLKRTSSSASLKKPPPPDRENTESTKEPSTKEPGASGSKPLTIKEPAASKIEPTDSWKWTDTGGKTKEIIDLDAEPTPVKKAPSTKESEDTPENVALKRQLKQVRRELRKAQKKQKKQEEDNKRKRLESELEEKEMENNRIRSEFESMQ